MIDIDSSNDPRNPANFPEVETITITKCCHSDQFSRSEMLLDDSAICSECGEETELIEVSEDYFR